MVRPDAQQDDRAPDTGGAPSAQQADDRRAANRAPYRDWAAVVFESEPTRIVIMRCNDVSHTGLCLVGQELRQPGQRGVIQLVRRDGRAALLGFVVARNDYQGDSQHHTGVHFAQPPDSIPAELYTDADGGMKLLHPMLRRVAG